MNFLSHFYFERAADDPYLVLGAVLPDLICNANKSWKIYPTKKPELFQNDPAQQSILKGWERHLSIDKHFHSSPFFEKHTKQLKKLITPWMHGSDVRPSFLAHISLELLLDGLLISENMVEIENFYKKLEEAQKKEIDQFLRLNNINETELFFRFFDQFIKSRYLNSYRDSEQIMYALNRICIRLWPQGLLQKNHQNLTGVLIGYQAELKKDFRQIYREIAEQLG